MVRVLSGVGSVRVQEWFGRPLACFAPCYDPELHSSFDIYKNIFCVSWLNLDYIYRVRINYRRISLRHNLSRKCCKIMKFVLITHSDRNIWNGPIVATAILVGKT